MPGFMALTGYLALSGFFILIDVWQGAAQISYFGAWLFPLIQNLVIIAYVVLRVGGLVLAWRHSLPVCHLYSMDGICRYWIAYIGSFLTLVITARWFRDVGKSNKGVWAPLWTFRIILNGSIMVRNRGWGEGG